MLCCQENIFLNVAIATPPGPSRRPLQRGFRYCAEINADSIKGVRDPLQRGFRYCAGINADSIKGVRDPLQRGFRYCAEINADSIKGVRDPLQRGFRYCAGISANPSKGVRDPVAPLAFATKSIIRGSLISLSMTSPLIGSRHIFYLFPVQWTQRPPGPRGRSPRGW